VRATTMSRRNLLAVGATGLVGASGISSPAKARTRTARTMTTEEIVRSYYKAWEKKDWSPVDALLAENFTFTSANDDGHISKSAFKKGCWETQIDFIDHFEIERLFGQDNEVFVKYLCEPKTASPSAMWSMSESEMSRWRPSNATSVGIPPFLRP